MKTICSWCGSMIRDGETHKGLVSHGMCASCAAEMQRRMDEEAEERAWAAWSLLEAPRCVLEQLAAGLAPVEAVSIAMELLDDLDGGVTDPAKEP